MKVRRQDNFTRVAQNEEIKYTIIRTFECLRGIFDMYPSTHGKFADTLFLFFLPVIEDAVVLVPIYDSYPVIIVCILQMFVDLMENVLCFLNEVSVYFTSSFLMTVISI